MTVTPSQRPGISPRPRASGAPGGDILVVDDNPANLLAIEAALGDLALGMQTASSGTEALRLLLERDFALVLLDVNMPSMNGFEAAHLIRERKRSRHTPIIFITAYSRDDKEILEAYQLGAVDFLFKPIVPEVLRAKATVFVELQRRTAEVALQAEQLREHERLLHAQSLEDERRRWEEESLRRQRDDAQRATEQISRKAEELAATIDEKERIEKALIRSNNELAAADRRKDEFLAVLGHELRNPLAPLVTGLELLKRGLEGDRADLPDLPALRRTREAMERQVKYLARLVDDLLDMSRITSGKIELRKAPVSVQEIVEQAVTAVRPALAERGHHLQITLPATPATLVADSVRLTQVLANLLNNAIRYTDDDGRIALSCEESGLEMIIRVSDNGRGIAPDLLPRIFEMFVQEQKGGGGLGLGLTLVERLVSLHGGAVEASSQGIGQGAVFTVRLPVGKSEVPVVRPLLRPRVEVPPLSIALVEDNADIRDTMKELLCAWGHRVQTAVDGPSGVALILKLEPDLAFVDIGLPHLDGYGVATEVRRQPKGRRTRLVAMSGFGQESDRRRSLEVGFNDHLVKPADIDAILNVLTPSPES